MVESFSEDMTIHVYWCQCNISVLWGGGESATRMVGAVYLFIYLFI